MTTPFGTPFERLSRSALSVTIVEPTLGLDLAHATPNLALGATQSSDNFIMREGALEPRSMLTTVGAEALANPLAARILGGLDVVDVSGIHYPMVSSATRLAWFAYNAWSTASYIGADPPVVGDSNVWDWTQIYADWAEENIAVGAAASRQSLYAWRPGEAAFSTLTGAPGAKTVTAFDNFLLAANLRDTDGGLYVQRVRWSDRGSASSWTGGISGFEDLLAAPGAITRLQPLESRVLVFFDSQIWQGARSDYPAVFRFDPLDTTLGCPYPWTIVSTADGVLFLGRDYRVYALAKAGGQAQPVSQRLHRAIRDAITTPTQSFAVYDPELNQYQLYYGVAGEAPKRAAWLQLDTGAWAQQSFSRVAGSDPLALTRGLVAEVQTSTGTTWAMLTAGGYTWADLETLGRTWAELGDAGTATRRVVLGSSAGTVFSLSSIDLSDAGTPVQSYWESGALGGDMPAAQKRLTEVRLDYRSVNTSALTLKTSPNQGATFDSGSTLTFLPTSTVSQTVVYPDAPARYPMFRVESQGTRYQLYRAHVTMRSGGR